MKGLTVVCMPGIKILETVPLWPGDTSKEKVIRFTAPHHKCVV